MTEAEWRKRLKAAHMCLDCGKQDAYTLNGYTCCYECNAKRNQIAKEYRANGGGAKAVEGKRRRKQQRREEHKCITCGKPLSRLEPYATCKACRKRDRARRRAQFVPKRLVGVVCYQCCQEPPMPGKKLCEKCYNANLLKLGKAWAVNREKKEVNL